MALIIHYEGLKHFNNEGGFLPGGPGKKQADQIGWFMMSAGITEITEKNIPELLFRAKFMDTCCGGVPVFYNPNVFEEKGTKVCDYKDVAYNFKKHLGLKIEVTNQGIKLPGTRHQFMVQVMRSMERDILWDIKDIDTDVSWKDHVKEEHVNN
jgi:hypothetical protein|tara:strand:- start:136 stop:594 length:459 start_codon:yes stop_codon:yes gene_type:complete